MILVSFMAGHAQIVTPGTGQTYTFHDFAASNPQTVTSSSTGNFTILQNITVSAGDTLLLEASTKRLLFNNPTILTVSGGLVCAPRTDTMLVTCNTSNCNSDFYDIRIENAGNCHFADILFEYGDNILVMQSEVAFERCVFRYFKEPCIKYSDASPVIEHCYFHENRKSAISSAANVTGAPKIRHNTFYQNVLNNINQPQINLGPGVIGDTIVIEDNWIEGYATTSGGIAIANLLSTGHTDAVIRGNTVINNRYGYTQQGPDIYAIIEDNTFKDNNLETNPMNGGSGISIYGTDTTCTAKLRRNLITGNLWGVTAINKHHIDMGTVNDPGNNCIFLNINNGVEYNLYNNATDDIEAVGNFWGSNDSTYAESVIFHHADNATYGLVNYLPVMTIEPDILAFSLWDETHHSEAVFHSSGNDTLCYDTDIEIPNWSHIVPNIALPMWVSCLPDPSDPQDFLTGPVNYTLTTVDGRSKDWVIRVVICPSVEYYDSIRVTVAPNPATAGQLVIHNDTRETVQVEVFALTGQQVYAGNCKESKMMVDTSSWSEGIYMLKASQNGYSSTFKVVVKH